MLGCGPIAPTAPDLERMVEAYDQAIVRHLHAMLEMKNGFYAFESALHVLSDSSTIREQGLLEWNSDELWRRNYDRMCDGALFFAEDVFGTQFCLRSGSVCTFDPETGSFEAMAENLENWATKILDDYDLWTGHRLARDWQSIHGPIPIGFRLLPLTPFVLGGEFVVENLHAVESVKGMKLRASIAVQIRDLPDGAKVTLQVVD